MTEGKERKRSRARVVAGVVLVFLILLLFGLGAVLVNVMRPPGTPKAGSLGSGLTWVRSIYGFGPRAEQQLMEPIGVAVDGSGRIYVTEPQRSRVTIFNRDGSFDGLITLMKNHDVSMVRPVGIDVDDAGRIYVADRALARIVVFGPGRAFERNIPCEGVTGVKIVGDRLYGISRDRIRAYSLKGELISEFGKMGREKGQLDGAYAVAVSEDGLLYVADSFNKRVSVYKPNGDYVRAIGRPATNRSDIVSKTAAVEDTSQPLFELPTGLVFDGSGRLVSLDAFQFGLSVFTEKGRLIDTYGEPGTSDGKFVYPSGLAYDRSGDVFVVTDTRNNRVQVLRIAGSGRARLDRIVPASFFQPVCYGPLALLLLAVTAAVLLSRRGRGEAEPAESAEPSDIPSI